MPTPRAPARAPARAKTAIIASRPRGLSPEDQRRWDAAADAAVQGLIDIGRGLIATDERAHGDPVAPKAAVDLAPKPRRYNRIGALMAFIAPENLRPGQFRCWGKDREVVDYLRKAMRHPAARSRVAMVRYRLKPLGVKITPLADGSIHLRNGDKTLLLLPTGSAAR